MHENRHAVIKMPFSWRCCVFLVLCVVTTEAQKRCPPPETILPCRCLMNKGQQFQIWCSHSDLPSVLEGLRAIGEFIPEPIDELILENNFLPSLPGRTFIPLNIMRLMLRYNGLERVSNNWLIGLEKSLMELFIVEPDLRSLPEDSLMQLDNIEAITIHTNLIKRYPQFSGLPKLRYLQLESLSLLELPARSFKDLPSLQTIHISNSPRLTRLEAEFLQDLPRLTLVNISYCGVDWMHPRAITRLQNLKELSFVGNKINDVGMVGRASRELPNLEILRLDHNYIGKIAEAAFVDLPSLKKIFLSNNHISALEYGAFHRVPMLRILDLNRNMVRRIHPESFLQHSGSGLEELWLVENEINHVAELRSLLDALPRLVFLDMSFNNLEAIPFGALRGHPTLERLHLDYNKIHLIDREAFMAMPALRELRLKNNSLSDILEGPLWNLPALKGLDLSGNYYRRLEPSLLANLPSLRRIDLSRNEITLIEPETFLMTPALEHVNLSYNALTSLHPATFRHLLKLYELDVSHNLLLEFVPNLPRGIENLHMGHNKIGGIPLPPSPDLDLPSLRMLDIADNGIYNIPPNSLRSLPQLRRLYVGKNNLQRLDENSLDGLSRLEIVDLGDNKIVEIHPKALNEMRELRELNLKNNRLDLLFPEMFKHTPQIQKLDVSRNQLAEILPGTLEKIKDVESVDASHNFLVQLPPNLFAMKNLRSLDLTNNRLKNLQPETLSSLIQLRELKLTNNFIEELKKGVFDNLQHLRTLHLDSNELEIIEPNAIKSLPVLKTLKINRNKLKEIPNFAFNNLPTLQVAELQENELKIVANNAFHMVPHLLVLNLSNNHLTGLEDAGLRSLKSLEMLDVSNNKISRVVGGNLENMEWLVELRMNDNDICGVHGNPFDGMSRLRVLNMRNNKMMSLPEQSVQKLRSNIAVLDIDGNPLACSCNLMWLQAWLQEGASMGPRCVDGTPLREIRLSRQECPPEQRSLQVVAPGCEAELLAAPGSFSTSQVFSQAWMNLKSNVSKESLVNKNNNLAPLPEESEYFYDEYVDYPYNETNHLALNTSKTVTATKSPHVISGDTPTIYAASKNNKTKSDIPKDVVNSPSSSGFTFFGVPLPSLNNLLGGSGRNVDKKQTQTISIPVAERKAAIVNHPPRGGGRGGLELPSYPEIQSGGFIPLLPGTGGFKPIPNPFRQPENSTTSTEMSTTENNFLRKDGIIGVIPTPPPTTTVSPIRESDNVLQKNISVVEDDITESAAKVEEVTARPINLVSSTTPELETTANKEKFEDLFGSVVENVDVVINTTEIANASSTAPKAKQEELTTPVSDLIINEDTSPSSSNQKEEAAQIRGTPLSALLVPGGQQPAVGRPTITKVQSPHVSGSAPLLSNFDVAQISEPLAHNREGKTTKEHQVITEKSTGIDNGRDDTSWYFANYNKTNNEPFVGVRDDVSNGGERVGVPWQVAFVFVLKYFL